MKETRKIPIFTALGTLVLAAGVATPASALSPPPLSNATDRDACVCEGGWEYFNICDLDESGNMIPGTCHLDESTATWNECLTTKCFTCDICYVGSMPSCSLSISDDKCNTEGLIEHFEEIWSWLQTQFDDIRDAAKFYVDNITVHESLIRAIANSRLESDDIINAANTVMTANGIDVYFYQWWN